MSGRSVAFLPRHGRHHELPPHRINYRANIWALRSVGVRRILAPCAVGGLTSDVAPGDLVVPDQLVDRTLSRAQTYIEQGEYWEKSYHPLIKYVIDKHKPDLAMVGWKPASGNWKPAAPAMNPR